MKIDVCMRVDDIEQEKIAGATAVVFDVLRATSTIVTALANSCRGVVPVAEVDAAREQVSCLRQHGLQVVLGGERGGKKLPGFDGGNSPLEYTGNGIAGKLLVLTTTNGTKTIRACGAAAKVYTGSIINAGAVARRVYSEGKDTVLVCAGTRGEFSLEDAVAAGLVVEHLKGMVNFSHSGLETTDAATAMARLAAGYSENIVQCLYDSVHGQKLLGLGFGADLDWCGQVNKFNVVPELDKEKGIIKL